MSSLMSAAACDADLRVKTVDSSSEPEIDENLPVDETTDGTSPGGDKGGGEELGNGSDPAVTAIRPLATKPGSSVTVLGSGFVIGATIELGGTAVPTTVVDSQEATFVLPVGTRPGRWQAVLRQGDETAAFTFYVLPASDEPLITEAPGDVCAGIRYYDQDGAIQDGAKDCGQPTTVCSSDGEVGCLAAGTLKAVEVAGFNASDLVAGKVAGGTAGSLDIAQLTTANIVAGVTIGGVAGAAVIEAHTGCNTDGAVGCVTSALYPAADMANVVPSNIRSGFTIGGVAGIYNGSNPNCSSDGQTSCVTVSGFRAADMSQVLASNVKTSVTLAGVTGTLVVESHSPCTADAESGCVAGASFKAAAMTNVVAGNIKDGVTIAGVTGGHGPACAFDGAGGCLVDGVAYKSTQLSNFTAADVKSGVTIAGVAGSATLESHLACASDGGINCVTVAAYPAASAAAAVASNIKAGVTIAGVTGIFGPTCATDGESACVVDGTSFKAAAMANFVAADVKSGVTIANVTGSATLEAHVSCASDGETGCAVTGPLYQAADATAAVAGNIKSGVTIAGVAGTFGPACSTDGGSACVVDGTSYKAAKLADFTAANIKSGITVAGVGGTAILESHANCAADAATACVSTAGYPAADALIATSGNIKSGVTIAGVAGTFGPACSVDGGSACVVDGSNYKAAKLANFAAGDVKSGVTVAGVAGTATLESHLDCAADAAIGCVTTSSYPAVNGAAASEGNIKAGVTIAGVLGQFPSSTYPLAGADGTTDLPAFASTTGGTNYEWFQSDGTRLTGALENNQTVSPSTANQVLNAGLYRSVTVNGDADLTAGNVKNGVTLFGITGAYPSLASPLTNADATADLDAATFATKIKSAALFEWFDSQGNRYTGGGDADITAANIASGVDIFGAVGTIATSPCTGDGQTNCLTTATYKSVDTTALSSWDVRKGKTIGGIAGDLYFPKNMAKISTFDRTSGTGALTGIDPFDSLDEMAAGTQYPAGWELANGANWVRDPLSDDGNGGGVSANGLCDGSEECVYIDRITSQFWARRVSGSFLWESAITACENLSYGGYADWRLPTEKELLQVYVNSVLTLNSSSELYLVTSWEYWSATTMSDDTTRGWSVALNSGEVQDYGKDQGLYVICTRP